MSCWYIRILLCLLTKGLGRQATPKNLLRQFPLPAQMNPHHLDLVVVVRIAEQFLTGAMSVPPDSSNALRITAYRSGGGN